MVAVAFVSSFCVALIVISKAAAPVPALAAKAELQERRDQVAAVKAREDLWAFTQETKQQLYSGGVEAISATLSAAAYWKSYQDGTGIEGEIEALKSGLNAWKVAEDEKTRNLISQAKFFLSHSLKEAKDAEHADRFAGTLPERKYEGEYDHAEETTEHALGHLEALEDETNDLVATLERHLKDNVDARLAALQKDLSPGQRQAAEQQGGAASSGPTPEDKALAAAQASAVRDAAAKEAAEERSRQEKARLAKTYDRMRHATIDKEAAEALAASAEKRAADKEAKLGRTYAALRHVVDSRDAAEKEAATAETAIKQRANTKVAKLKEANVEEHTMEEVLIAGLAVAMLVPAMLYINLFRLKRQNAYHVSAIMKLNVDRMACMQKIKELTRPILEEGVPAQASTAGTGGMEAD